MTAEADTMFAVIGEAELAQTDTIFKADWSPVLPAPIANPPPSHPEHRRWGKPSHVWTYRDAAGVLLFQVYRFDPAGRPKEILPFTYGRLNDREGWHWKAPKEPRPLYGLDRLTLLPNAPV